MGEGVGGDEDREARAELMGDDRAVFIMYVSEGGLDV